jgi:hypothetical protein
MFEEVIAAMLKRKQIFLAAIAVTALIGYVAPPITQVAYAQTLAEDIISGVFGDGGGAEEEDAAAEEDADDGVDQDLDQDLEQDQDAENTVTQSNDQSEEFNVDNSLNTGDAIASVSQSNEDQEVAAASEAAAAAEGGESEAEGGSDDNGHKDKKHSYDGNGGGDASSSADATAIADSVATATGIQSNTATVNQDTSISDITQDNDVRGGDDRNIQLGLAQSDQDQRAANLAAQLGIDFDFDNQYGYAFSDLNDENDD